jgi:hypothetical protein
MAGIFHSDTVREHIAILKERLAEAEPGSPRALALQAQLAFLENEISDSPPAEPIFGFWGGGGHGGHGGQQPSGGGGHGGGGSHR